MKDPYTTPQKARPPSPSAADRVAYSDSAAGSQGTADQAEDAAQDLAGDAHSS